MRLQSHIWVSALLRRVQAEGCFATVLNRGADSAGAIFVVVSNMQGQSDLYGPALQMHYGETVEERRFQCLAQGVSEQAIQERIEKEKRFDPDIWLIEIEDRQQRPFIDADLIVEE